MLVLVVVLHCVGPAPIVRTYHHILGTVGSVLHLSHGGVAVYRGGRTPGGCRVMRWGKPGVDMSSLEPETQPWLAQEET